MKPTLAEALLDAAEAGVGGVAFVGGDGGRDALGFAEITQRAARVAGGLRRLGVRPGDAVALVLPTGPAFYEAFFGAVLAGAVPCALYPPLRLGRLAEWTTQTTAMLRSLGTPCVVTEPRLTRIMRDMAAAAAARLGVTTVTDLAAAGETLIDPNRDAAATAVVQFSSGTTGQAKPVRLTHANIRVNVAGFLQRLPCKAARPSAVCWLPLYHDLGLFGNVMAGIWSKADLTLIPPQVFLARPVIWFEQLTATGAELSAAPNFAFGLCTKRIRDDELRGIDLSRWSGAICAAETIHRHTIDAFVARFAPHGFRATAIVPAYGLAEATVGVTVAAAGRGPLWRGFDRDALARVGEARDVALAAPGAQELIALGRPLPEVQVEIRDARGRPLPERRVGEVHVAGPNVHTACAGAWLATGDRGFVCDGELFLWGRLKDTVILNGRNFDPAVFEAALLQIPGLRTGCGVCFSASLSGDRDSESLVVLAELPRADDAGAAALRAAIIEHLSTVFHLMPGVVELLPPGTLPRTSSGKLQRGRARDLWATRGLRPPRRGAAWQVFLASCRGLYGPALRRLRATAHARRVP